MAWMREEGVQLDRWKVKVNMEEGVEDVHSWLIVNGRYMPSDREHQVAVRHWNHLRQTPYGIFRH